MIKVNSIMFLQLILSCLLWDDSIICMDTVQPNSENSIGKPTIKVLAQRDYILFCNANENYLFTNCYIEIKFIV